MGRPLGDAAVELAVELVGLDTVNPGLEPGGGGERAAVDAPGRPAGPGRLRLHGDHAARAARPAQPAGPHGTSDAGPRPRSGAEVVAAQRSSRHRRDRRHDRPVAAQVVGDRRTGRLLGRGACDMKARGRGDGGGRRGGRRDRARGRHPARPRGRRGERQPRHRRRHRSTCEIAVSCHGLSRRRTDLARPGRGTSRLRRRRGRAARPGRALLAAGRGRQRGGPPGPAAARGRGVRRRAGRPAAAPVGRASAR